MSRISLKFTKKDGKLCLCALVKGTQVRHYKVVNVLTKLLEEYQFESGKDLFAMHDLAGKERIEQTLIKDQYDQSVALDLDCTQRRKPHLNLFKELYWKTMLLS